MSLSTSVNATTASAASDLSAFAAYMNVVWMTGNIIVETIAIPASFISSIAIVIVLSRVHEGIAVSAKIYYVTLAIMDFFAVFGYHFLLSYLCENLMYMTNGRWYVAVETSDAMCRLITFLMRQSEHTANWLYFVLCAEKCVAVRDPLRARTRFTRTWSCRVVLFCVLSAIPVDVLAGVAFGSVYYPIWGLAYCTTLDYFPSAFLLFVRLYIAVTIYFLPSALTLLAGCLLLQAIFEQASRRRSLKVQADGEATAGLNGAVTVLFMAGIHCLLYLPLAILSVWATVLVLSVTSYVTYSVTYIYWLFLNVSALAHCPNLIIYIARIPAFRAAFLCRNSKQL